MVPYSRFVPLLDLVTLPARLAAAGVDTTLALGRLVAADGPVRRPQGYADRLMAVIGEGGLVDRIATVVTDPDGPRRIVDQVADTLAPDRPLGQALAPGGAVDRLVESGGALERLTRSGGVLERLLAEDGLLDRLLTEDGFVEKLVAEGGTLDQLVALGDTLERIQPRLDTLARLVPDLHASVTALNEVVEPLGQLAGRIPGARRKPPVDV